MTIVDTRKRNPRFTGMYEPFCASISVSPHPTGDPK